MPYFLELLLFKMRNCNILMYNKNRWFASVAQWIEHQSSKLLVESSSLS